jgi:hypothetical protein
LQPGAGAWKTIPLEKIQAGQYTATVPAETVLQGVLKYRIIIRQDSNVFTFPSGHTGEPYGWNYYYNDAYETFVVSQQAALSLFDATQDRNNLTLYNPDWQHDKILSTTTAEAGQLALQLTINQPDVPQQLGFQLYAGDRLTGRKNDLAQFDALVIKAHSTQPQPLTITLITKTGAAFTNTVTIDAAVSTVTIPLADLQVGQQLLLPRPYPGFMPLYFKADTTEQLNLQNIDKLQVSMQPARGATGAASLEIQSITLEHTTR